MAIEMRPAIALIAMSMSADAFRFQRHLRDHHFGAASVLIVPSCVSEDDLNHAIRLRFDAVFAKPLRAAFVRLTVTQLLRGPHSSPTRESACGRLIAISTRQEGTAAIVHASPLPVSAAPEFYPEVRALALALVEASATPDAFLATAKRLVQIRMLGGVAVANSPKTSTDCKQRRSRATPRPGEAFGRAYSHTSRLQKLQSALKELAHSNEHVKQIAYASGYAHPSVLVRDCRTLLGMTPTTYRVFVRG